MPPIDSYSSAASTVTVDDTAWGDLAFSVSTIPNVAVSDMGTSIRWTSSLRGADVHNGAQPGDGSFDNKRTFRVERRCSLYKGEHTVTATVRDHSPRVRRTDTIGRRLIATGTWTLDRLNRAPVAVTDPGVSD